MPSTARPSNELAGRVALVTGASRGIGAAAALALEQAGAAVALVARDGGAVTHIADEIVGRGGRAAGLVCDVADYASVHAVVEEAKRRFGAIDVLVNNAGLIEPIASLAESEPADFARNLAVNLLGPYHVMRAALPQMLAAGRGTVINLSSGAAHHPLQGWSAYCSAKAGLAMLTRAAALEIAGSGLRVFGLSPGVIDTDMQATIRASGVNRISRLSRADLAPADHPAAAIVYLCTEAAADLAGTEVSLADPEFRRRVGLA